VTAVVAGAPHASGRVAGEGARHRALPSLPSDPVNHPAHYTSHPSGVECITVAEHYGFNIGNAIKYLWRAGLKGGAIEDLKKAAWYVNREIEKRTKEDEQ